MRVGTELDKAVMLYIKDLVDTVYTNKTQDDEYQSPFENTAENLELTVGDRKMEIHAFFWGLDCKDGYFKFTDGDKVLFHATWYKYCPRALEIIEEDLRYKNNQEKLLEDIDDFLLKWKLVADQEEMKRAINDPETIKRAAQGAIEQQKEFMRSAK